MSYRFDNPPIVNNTKKPIQNNIGVYNLIDPPYMVDNHENIFIPVGKPIIIDAAEK